MTCLRSTVLVQIMSLFIIITAPASADEPSLASYEKIYIAPVSIDLPERTYRRGDDRPVSKRDQEDKAEDLETKLTRAFSEDFAIVSAPGEGVLTIETDIIRLQSSRPTKADLNREPGLSFSSVFTGGATVSFTLSEDGVTLDEIEDSYYGNFNDGSPRTGIWQDADRAFSRLSNRLVRYVQNN